MTMTITTVMHNTTTGFVRAWDYDLVGECAGHEAWRQRRRACETRELCGWCAAVGPLGYDSNVMRRV